MRRSSVTLNVGKSNAVHPNAVHPNLGRSAEMVNAVRGVGTIKSGLVNAGVMSSNSSTNGSITSTDPLDQPHNIGWNHPLWSLFMAIEHDRIHIETSSVLIRELPFHLVQYPDQFPKPHGGMFSRSANSAAVVSGSSGSSASLASVSSVTPSVSTSASPTAASASRTATRNPNAPKDHLPKVGLDFPQNEMIHMNGTSLVKIGKDLNYPSYGWDNEYGERVVKNVPEFRVSKYLVSNGEFYEFVVEGGYREEKYWSEEGWRWRRYRNVKWPAFWVQDGPQGSHRYKLRTIFHISESNIPWSFPVIVNQHEAKAFLKWKSMKQGGEYPHGLRLLTEIEQMMIRDPKYQHDSMDRVFAKLDVVLDPSLVYSGGDVEMLEKGRSNLGLAFGSESPVDFQEPNSFGLHDVSGNVWHWLEDDAHGLGGFKPHPYYDDFSTPCFDAQHKMIMGGSFVTSGDAGANLYARFHFRPHFLQHSGFRYVDPMRKESIPGAGVARYLSAQEARGGKVAVGATSAATTVAAAPTSHSTSAPASPASTPTSNSVAPADESKRDQASYETQTLVQQYLGLHFGQLDRSPASSSSPPTASASTTRDLLLIPHKNRPDHALGFPQRCVDIMVNVGQRNGSRIGPNARALDLGCAVGGSSFELSKWYQGGVVGVDLSGAFIRAAESVKQSGKCEFMVPHEGKTQKGPIKVDVMRWMGLSQKEMNNVTFLVGDACAVESIAGFPKDSRYDAILMGNLLCRLPSPRRCLDQMSGLLNENGILALASPYSWLEQFTPESEWIGGGGSGSNVASSGADKSKDSFEVLKEYLEMNAGLKLVHEENVPLIIKEHNRKYQYIVSHMTIFKKV